ncbi:MAG: exosortase-associated EpsI family protein [Planctomycetota bacterium]
MSGVVRWLALAILILSAASLSGVIASAGINLKKTAIYPRDNRQLSSIPTETEHWTRLSADRIESPEIVETLGTSNYLTRTYIRRSDMETDRPMVIEFHAAYYTGAIDTVPHVPERCFVGGGLQQSKSSRILDLDLEGSSWLADPSVEPEFAGVDGTMYSVRLPNDTAFTDAPGRRVRLPRGVGPDSPFRIKCSEFSLPGGGSFYAGYFFIANGGTVASANGVRTLAFDLSADYAYYLKVQVNSATVGSMEELAEVSAGLIDELIGELMRCVPDWVEVQRGVYPEDRPDANAEPGAGPDLG